MPDTLDVAPFALALGRKSIAGAGAGGTVETQEMLDFCAKHDLTADIELIATQDINTGLERLAANDVKYRFVVDMTA